MTRKLHLSPDVALHVDWMSLATVVYGARGSGKTTLCSVLAEELHKAGQRFCAIDLKGDWWGLRSSEDGQSPAIPVVIFGGDHADVPLEPDAGSFVGETVAQLGQSVILDLENLSKKKQIVFLTAFFETLYDKNREPLMLFLDEAQRYAPQKTFDPESAKCLGAVEDLVKLGRKHGLGVTVITQRGAGLNKEISELCDILMACRAPGPLDHARVQDWLDVNVTRAQRDEVMPVLSSLRNGQVVMASAHPDVKLFGVYPVRRRETFDSSATPRVGERRKTAKKLAEPDLDALRTKMSAAIERQKADDPRALRGRIAQLEKELRAKPAAVVAVPVDTKEIARLTALSEQLFAQLQRSEQFAATLVTEFESETKELNERLRDLRARLIVRKVGKIPAIDPRKALPPPPAVPKEAREVRAPRELGVVNSEAAPSLKKGARDILVAAAAARDGVTKSQAATICGIKVTGSTMSAYMSNLRTAGLIEERGDRIYTTTAGMAAAREIDPDLHVLTRDERLALWRGRLKRGARDILDALVKAYPAGVDREHVAALVGINTAGSTLSAYVSNLVTNGLARKEGSSLFATDELLEDI